MLSASLDGAILFLHAVCHGTNYRYQHRTYRAPGRPIVQTAQKEKPGTRWYKGGASWGGHVLLVLGIAVWVPGLSVAAV